MIVGGAGLDLATTVIAVVIYTAIACAVLAVAAAVWILGYKTRVRTPKRTPV